MGQMYPVGNPLTMFPKAVFWLFMEMLSKICYQLECFIVTLWLIWLRFWPLPALHSGHTWGSPVLSSVDLSWCKSAEGSGCFTFLRPLM